MKKLKLWLGSLALLSVLVVYAETSIRYEAKPGSKMKIDGTSTIHDWTVESQLIGGFMEFDATFPKDPAAALKVKPKVEVTILVRSLKSGKKAMDNVMYEAMKQQQHPKIEYRLLQMTPKDPSKRPPGPIQFDTTGALTVAGVTKTNNMVVTLDFLDDGTVKASGVTNLKMTDFGIQPPAPSLALGLIKTADDVKLTFEWLTAPKKETAATAAPATAAKAE